MKSLSKIIGETISKLCLPQAAISEGRSMRGLDWLKCARMISEKKPDRVVAGLKEDFSSTAYAIFDNGEVVKDEGGWFHRHGQHP